MITPRVCNAVLALVLLFSSTIVFADGAQPPILAEFDIAKNGDFIIIPVRVGDNDYPFLIDTGSTLCVFDEKLRALLGTRRRHAVARTAGGRMGVEVHDAPELRSGDVMFTPRLGALCSDLHSHTVSSGENFYGIIGLDVLTDKILSVDFDAGKLRFLKRVDAGVGEMVPLIWSRDGDSLRGPGILAQSSDTQTDLFFIDTGRLSFSAGSLEPSRFDQMIRSGQLRRIPHADGRAYTASGEILTTEGRLRALTLGSFTHKELIFRRRDEASAKNALGLAYLSRYVITFDFPQRRMFLRKGNAFDRADTYGLSGLTFGRDESATIVTDVAAGSVAAIAGLHQGDKIDRVDGVRVAEESLFETCRRFTEPGARQVRFIRNGQNYQAKLILAEPN